MSLADEPDCTLIAPRLAEQADVEARRYHAELLAALADAENERAVRLKNKAMSAFG